LGTETIVESEAEKLFVGRWEGWQTLFGGKPSPVSFHIISVAENVFVKACSDRGMIFGRLTEEGYLELPRFDSVGLAYSIRLWRSSAPRSRDLEGVALLEVRPSELLVAGLVWLSRALRFDWTTPPSSYFCQDRDLEEQRRYFREEKERMKSEETWKQEFIELKGQIQHLMRELEKAKFDLETASSRSLVGGAPHESHDVDAK
jgi:hypothetical protein